jgi:hypothetical protein
MDTNKGPRMDTNTRETEGRRTAARTPTAFGGTFSGVKWTSRRPAAAGLRAGKTSASSVESLQIYADGDRHVDRCLAPVHRSLGEGGCGAGGVATSGPSVTGSRPPFAAFCFHSAPSTKSTQSTRGAMSHRPFRHLRKSAACPP